MSSLKTQGSKWASEASTNVFYFASLKEIKWKVYESSTPLTVEPCHPVISTCSKLFRANRLVTWHLGRNGLQLWIFYWPADDIDFNSISLLKEVQQGVWDNGLPSDSLSHLYKAVHQHFERALFKTGYARVGKYFVKADGTFQKSFQLGFFIHGGHHLCASIELRDKVQVHFLRKSYLENVQEIKVILMPIGIECNLTGKFINLISSTETLNELEEVFPAYQIDRNDPNNTHKMFLVETEISGHTMLYPASHVLIVNNVLPPKPLKETLRSLNDEVGGITSTEGEVTAASTTLDTRDPANQQAVWRESGYWTYKPPPDNLKCPKHSNGPRSTVVESTVGITKRARTSLQKNRLQRSAYRSNLEQNKYKDDSSPVITPPTLPIKNSKVPSFDLPRTTTKTAEPLPRLKPIPRPDYQPPPSGVVEPFDSQPLTIECVENTACRDENKQMAELIPGLSLSQRLYKIPSSISRQALPVQDHRRPPPPPRAEPIKRPVVMAADSPVKKIKLDPRVEVSDLLSSNTTSKSSDSGGVLQSSAEYTNTTTTTTTTATTTKSHHEKERQKNFTHYVDIRVDQHDLDDKLFQSESSDSSDDENQTVMMETGVPVVPESVLTPDNGSDGGKCLLSPLAQQAPHSHDYPTPPSNDPANNYQTNEEVLPTEDKSSLCERKDSYQQLLFDATSYSAVSLKKNVPSLPETFTPNRTKTRGAPPSKRTLLNSSPNTSPSEMDGLNISKILKSISAELKDIGSCAGSPGLSRTLHMPISKEEMSFKTIAQVMLTPDKEYTAAPTNGTINRKLSDLPKLQGGPFLIKFGDCILNKFSVNSDEAQLPGGYSCIQNENKSVLLDTTRMEIYTQNEHKSTVGYLPKTSISISLYQTLENKVTKLHNPTPFAAVRNSRFSEHFLKILQQEVRNVSSLARDFEEVSLEEAMATTTAIDTVGKLLEDKLPTKLVLQKPRTCILPWKSFTSLAEKYNTGQGEQPLPALLLGNDQQWVSVSPLSVPVWLSKGMEPYSGKQDVNYLVVTPDNPHIINNIHIFFKDLSTLYELCLLGQHKQLTTKIREGMLRISRKSADNITNQHSCDPDPWFIDKSDPESPTWQVYAKICQHVLGRYLSTLLEKQGDKVPKNIVIYFIDPFKTRDVQKKRQLLTRCFNSMQEELNKIKNTHFIMQSIPADFVSDSHKNNVKLKSTMKNVCFSVYSQALKQVKRKPLPTCLTGFGPISAEIVLDAGEQREASQPPACHIYNPLYVLKSKPHTETATSNLDTLFCAYCLSHDNNWAIVGVTDGSGNLLDTAIYAIDEPSRQGVSPPVLAKIWSFCLNVVESYKAMWCLVITKMGIVTDCEDAFWTERFASVPSWNSQLQERCGECVLSNTIQQFGVASVSLLSTLNTPHLHLLPLLNRPKTLDFRTSSQILLLSPEQPLVETMDRYKKLHDDSISFYSGAEQSRERKRKILSSAYLASSAKFTELPKHMGTGRSSVLLGNLHHHTIVMTSKKHVLLGDNHPLVLRFILQQFDSLSWLQLNPTNSGRLSPLPLHMFTVSNIYVTLEEMTYVPP